MSQLNAAWMFTAFIMAAQQTAAGSFMEADTAIPEINDLVKRKYLKLNKKLLNDGTKCAGVVPQGAYAIDLIADLGLDMNEFAAKIPGDLVKPVDVDTATAPVATAQPAAPVLEQTAPVADVQPQVPQVAQPAAYADAQPAAPTVGVATAAPIAAVVDTSPASVGGTVQPTTVQTVQRRDVEIPLALGVAYVKPQSGIARARTATPQEEAYPYKEIVELKKANPKEAPSFHLVGKKSKDVSGMIRRHALRYEESDNVTFRAQAVGADDPNGVGVRVFALFVEEAPKRPTRKAKTADVQPAV